MYTNTISYLNNVLNNTSSFEIALLLILDIVMLNLANVFGNDINGIAQLGMK